LDGLLYAGGGGWKKKTTETACKKRKLNSRVGGGIEVGIDNKQHREISLKRQCG